MSKQLSQGRPKKVAYPLGGGRVALGAHQW